MSWTKLAAAVPLVRVTVPPAVQFPQTSKLPGAERVKFPAVVIPPTDILPEPVAMLNGVPEPVTHPAISDTLTSTAFVSPLKLTKVAAEMEPLEGPPVTVMAPAAAWLNLTLASVELSCEPAPMFTVNAPALLLMSRFPVEADTIPFWVNIGVVRVTAVPETVEPTAVVID